MSPASNDSISGSKRFFSASLRPALPLSSRSRRALTSKISSGFHCSSVISRARLSSSASRCSAISFFPYCSLTRAISKRISHRLRLVV